MSQRKVKDAKDLENDELIYFKSHAKATFMSDGRTVEDAINQVGTGGGSGGIVTETDPIFSASPSAKITDENISSWNNKVEAVDTTDIVDEPAGVTYLTTAVQHLTEEEKNQVKENIGVGKVSGVAESAKKLETTRTIWGQSFDGTGDVSGDLNRVGRIIRTEPSAVDMDFAGNFIFKNLNSASVNYWHVDTANGTPIFVVHNKGNVGVGTTSPLAKLHVVGGATPIMCESKTSESSIYFVGTGADSAYRWAIGKGIWNMGGKFGIGEYGTAKNLFVQINTNGYVGIGVPYSASPSERLHVNGNAIVSGTMKVGGKYVQEKIDIIDHGTSDTTFALTPNVLHKWGEVSSLTLNLSAASNETVANYYMIEFVSGATPTSLAMPDSIAWASDLTIEANKTYQISILNGCGVIGGF